jgi:thiazole synthase
MLGTGKYKTTLQMQLNSIQSSECEIVTVAIRRLPTNLKNDSTSFLNNLNWKKLWLLPNTAGSQTAEEAIRMAFLGHELACQLDKKITFL